MPYNVYNQGQDFINKDIAYLKTNKQKMTGETPKHHKKLWQMQKKRAALIVFKYLPYWGLVSFFKISKRTSENYT